jgi:hypothetical protein
MISEEGEDKGLMEVRDNSSFKYVFSSTLIIFKRSILDNKAKIYKGN